MYITVKDAQEAWNEVNRIFPYDYKKDEKASTNAGYPIYYSTSAEHPNNWISDLGDRLEVNLESGESTNIWIVKEEGKKEMENTNNSSYLIYITGSADAARLISRGLIEATPWSKRGGKTISISTGCVHENNLIPPLYHGSDKFYAILKYRNGEDWSHPEYKLIIC